MENIVEYRNDAPARNDYPRRIVSPLTPSSCCAANMTRVGQSAIDATWRFYYKRCSVCGYTVRCFYAPSLTAMFEAGRQVRLALAEMNLGTNGRKRRTRAEIAAAFDLQGAEATQAAALADRIDGQSVTNNKMLYILRVESVMMCLEDHEDRFYHNADGTVNRAKIYEDILITG